MPLYNYDSFNRRGIAVKGTIDAASQTAAKDLLRGQGLMPVMIKEASLMYDNSLLSLLFERPVSQKILIDFTKQLAVLLRSSVPLLQAIDLLTEQFDGRFKRVLMAVREGIQSGESFAKELAKHPRIFSQVYIQLVKAGEASGKLEIILERLTDYLMKAEEIKSRVNSALRGPIITLSFAVVVVIALLIFLVPTMVNLLTQFKVAMPASTAFLIGVSSFLVDHYVLLFFIFFGFVIWITYWKNTKAGKYYIDDLLLRMPLTSYYAKTTAVVQFSKTLGLLIESGVNLAEALDIVCNVVENNVLATKLREARDNIIKEGRITKYLQASGVFPSIALYMIGTGEQSGKLGQMLVVVGNDYETQLSEITDRLVASINPVVTIVMGLIIGFIVIAIMLPMLSIGDVSDSMYK